VDFYFGLRSGNSARVAFALEEAGAQYVPHPVNVPAGESRTPEYRALNPMGKVPALTDGDFRLWESNAINWYVAEKHPDAHLIPSSIAERAAVQRWLYFQVGHVTPACVTVFRATNERVRAFWRLPPTAPAQLDAARAELARYLPVLEQALADREWLEGDFTLADLAYAPHFKMVADGGYDFAPTPRVGAWLERLWARPAWQRAEQLVFADNRRE